MMILPIVAPYEIDDIPKRKLKVVVNAVGQRVPINEKRFPLVQNGPNEFGHRFHGRMAKGG